MSTETADNPRAVTGNNQVRDYVERYKNLIEEQAAIAESIKELGTEAKSNGLNPMALKAVAKRECEDPDKARRRKEKEEVITLYASSIGVVW